MRPGQPRRLGPGRLLAASCTALILLPAATAAAGVAPVAQPRTTTPIKHFVVLMQENHSFDNYFGTYPGAVGLLPSRNGRTQSWGFAPGLRDFAMQTSLGIPSAPGYVPK